MILNGLINKILFIVQLLAAEIMFTCYLKRSRKYALRLAGCIVASVAAATLFPVPVNDALYSAMMYMLLFGLTVVMFKLCYDEKWLNILFCCIAAYTTQHFAYMFTNFVVTSIEHDTSPLLGFYGDASLTISGFDNRTLFAALIWLLCTYVTYAASYFLFVRQIKRNRNITIRRRSLLFLVGAGLICDIVLNLLFVYLDVSRTLVGSLIIYVYGCFCCVLLLCVQFEIVAAKKFEDERDFVKSMWSREKEQYALSKDTIDSINLKCHDIKHQIREIGKNKRISQEAVDEIERAVSIYDAAISTGNDVLDIILTEKSILCYKDKISFSCIADGSALAFMNETDIYALFGNAIDNAIEAVLKLDSVEERIIGLNMRKVGSMISLNIHNSFSGDIRFENGLPKTTKQDERFHGYGMKSIKMIVEKYGGSLDVTAADGIFNLDILFPQNESANN